MNSIKNRFNAARGIAVFHLACGMLVLAVLAFLIFGVWFPYPYAEITGGRQIFLVIVAVDIICGPLLTLLIFDPFKEKWKWRLDIVVIVALQLGAMIYGLERLTSVRPVFLAYEGDRFRIVRANDIDADQLGEASPDFMHLSWSGPRLIGAKLLTAGDPLYLDSLVRSINGEPPSLRPSRWVKYETQLEDIRKNLQPVQGLTLRGIDNKSLEDIAKKSKDGLSSLGYFPMVLGSVDDWVVVVDRNDGLPKGYLHIDGW
ncbi:hypothetical protein [Comamonas sp. MYb69]|uniref:hypothetical protein n=1 Tax=Comamonas sp. MYb69 TaxID=1848650 RepID=UPI0030B18D3D